MTIGGPLRDHRSSRLATLDPVLLRRVVDLACGVFAVALFLRLADPEILLQGLWLTVAIGAFIYGLAAALWRILVATVVMVGYLAVSDAVGVPPTEEQLEFTEWPLMVAIAVIGAVLADRVSTSARHYATLYRKASERLVTAHEEERGVPAPQDSEMARGLRSTPALKGGKRGEEQLQAVARRQP